MARRERQNGKPRPNVAEPAPAGVHRPPRPPQRRPLLLAVVVVLYALWLGFLVTTALSG